LWCFERSALIFVSYLSKDEVRPEVAFSAYGKAIEFLRQNGAAGQTGKVHASAAVGRLHETVSTY